MPRIRSPFVAPPTGLIAWLFRLPVYVYRARLGFVFRSKFLMLVHRGRKTGQVRRTVLEVMGRNAEEYVVMTGWGRGSQWYRNIEANPPLEVHVGRRRFTPETRFLSDDEAAKVLDAYATRRPKDMRMLDRALGLQYDGTFEDLERIVADRPMVGLRPVEA
jgi:deazaflavin-dependent oxidoreductase (nitroreductase family)